MVNIMEQAHFKKYQHVESLRSSEVEGIDKGKVYIFPKLDGTNASIWVELDDNNEYVICGGSRNNKLTVQWDNAGFYKHVLEHPEYKEYLLKHPTYIVYGEWLVTHTIKDYDVHAWKKFYVFDVFDTVMSRYLSYEEYCAELTEAGFDVIPPMTILDSPDLTEETLNNLIVNNHYLMKDNEHIGEGIVIKNYEYRNAYGRTTWAKVVNVAFKTNSRAKCKGGVPPTVEDVILDALLTEEAITHEVLKFEDEYGKYEAKNYKMMLGLVWKGWIEDNIWKVISKAGKNSINFTSLRHKAEIRVKEYYPL